MTYFSGKKVFLATKHGKESVIAPLLKEAFDMDVIVPEDFDTDRFGTFTREVKRDGTQREAAYRKAKACMDLYDADFVLASEGSFGVHPSLPFISSNLEFLLLIDRDTSLELSGQALSSDTNMHAQYLYNFEEFDELAEKLGFPEHGLIARFHKHLPFGIYKDFSSESVLKDRIEKMLSVPFFNRVYIETDMRANRNPTRMKVIEEATHDLIRKMKSCCPNCDIPGFIPRSLVGNKSCRECFALTEVPSSELIHCYACGLQVTQAFGDDSSADPSKCLICNP